MTPTTSSAALVCCLAVLAIAVRTWTKKNNGPPLPPGPRADPFIGHLRHMPREDMEGVFTKWSQTYGDIMHLHLPGRSVVVISSLDAANDILDKKSANYSDRPSFPVYDMLGWSKMLPFLHYGKRFHKHRKAFQDQFSRKAVADFETIQSRSAQQLVNLLLDHPADYYESLLRYTVSILIQIIYGHVISSDGDWLFQLAKANGKVFTDSGPPGGTAIDLLPVLRHFPSWFPGTHFATFARKAHYISQGWLEQPYLEIQESLKKGENPLCFMTQQLESYDPKSSSAGTDLEDIKSTCATAFSAGADTTWATLLVFALAMTLHPEYQNMAQEEIDRVVGSDRLPTLSDRDQLPLVDAILKEVLRWHPVAPLAIPHSSLENDVYRGMLIPKGSFVIANVQAMSQDTRVYLDPHSFNPLRYFPHPRGRNEPAFWLGFGFGRRICPGRHLADTSLWLAISTMLATVNFSKFVDVNGVKHEPEVVFTTGLASHPMQFQCTIESRNEKARALVDQSLSWDI